MLYIFPLLSPQNCVTDYMSADSLKVFQIGVNHREVTEPVQTNFRNEVVSGANLRSIRNLHYKLFNVHVLMLIIIHLELSLFAITRACVTVVMIRW